MTNVNAQVRNERHGIIRSLFSIKKPSAHVGNKRYRKTRSIFSIKKPSAHVGNKRYRKTRSIFSILNPNSILYPSTQVKYKRRRVTHRILPITKTSGKVRNQRYRNVGSRTSNLKGELGGNFGVSNFQGDYTQKGLEGLRNDKIVLNGISINATYSLHIMQKWKSRKERKRSFETVYFELRNHLILKSNLGFTNGSFDNLGISTGKESLNPPTTRNNILLGRASAKTSILSFGTQLEYYFSNMLLFLDQSRRYEGTSRRYNKGAFYVGIGLGINCVNSKYDYDVPSDVPSSNIWGLPDRYNPQVLGGLDNSIVFSGNFALGYRHRLNHKIDLVTELKTNYYFSDRIDATNTTPNSELPPTGIENEFNDYNTVLSIGAIYHLF